MENAVNIFQVHNKLDHESFLRELKKGVGKIAVLGANLESLELVSTLRREYPKIEITVIDENRESVLDNKFGKDVAKSLIQ